MAESTTNAYTSTVTGTLNCYAADYTRLASQNFYVRLMSIPSTIVGHSFYGTRTVTTDSNGVLTITCIPGATYLLKRGNNDEWTPFTAPTANAFSLPNVIEISSLGA